VLLDLAAVAGPFEDAARRQAAKSGADLVSFVD
jgi:hypothetical protein